MLTISVNVDQKSLARLNLMPDDLKRGVLKGLKMAGRHLEGKVKARFGTSGNLKVKTGRLRTSIKSGVEGTTAWVGTDVVYAPTHEFGATIRPRKGEYLRFMIGNQWYSAKQIKIPPRPFLGPTLDAEADNVRDIIADYIIEELTK